MYHSSTAHCCNVLKTFLTRDSDTVHCPNNSIITVAPPHAEALWKHQHKITHNRNRQLPYDRFAHHRHLKYRSMYVSNNNNNSNSKIKKGIRKNSVALAVAKEKNQQKTRAKSGKAKHKKIE